EVQPIREPLVDLFDEDREVLIVAELPGVDRDEIELDLSEDILTLDAEHDELKYHKEILLPRSYSPEQMHTDCRNGVLEIRLASEEEGEEEAEEDDDS